jgi:hypothetical protein
MEKEEVKTLNLKGCQRSSKIFNAISFSLPQQSHNSAGQIFPMTEQSLG